VIDDASVAPAARVAASARPHRRSRFEWAVDRVWRFFCSVRIGIAEIATLAILVLIGTLRNSSVPQWIADHVPAAASVVAAWYGWDVFHSFLFMANMTLLAIGIAIGGIINRAPGLWSSIAHPPVATTHGFIRGAEASASAAVAIAPDELADRLTASLRAARHRVLTERRGDEIHLYADRWRYGKLGTIPFHVALILVLVGGIVGARWGFRDDAFFLPEGATRDVGHGTGLSVQLNEFVENYNENGIAKEYRSGLTIFHNGTPVKTGSVTVNHPLTLGDVVFYQSGFGQAVALKIAGADGKTLYDDALPLGEFRSKSNPDAPAAVLDLPPAGISLTVIAPDENPANQPELDTLHLASGQMYLTARPLGPDSPLKQVESQVVTQGDSARFGAAAVTFEREKRFSVLQVARNPGIPIFIAAALLLVGGLAITFYFPHRRIRAIVGPDGAGGRLEMAPMARRDWGAQRAFERVVDDLEQRLGAPLVRSARTGDDAPETAGSAV
jgi:cytochrome c biogenesis protein